MALIADDAPANPGFKSVAVAALHQDVSGRLNLPVVLHDQNDSEIFKALVTETYEELTASSCRSSIVPGYSAIVKTNADQLSRFRNLEG